MSKEKQIEEMAKALTKYEKGLCERLPKDQCLLTSAVHAQVSCDYCKIAEFLYNAGYRKSEWISVEERLPERIGYYLGCTYKGGILIAPFFPVFANDKPEFHYKIAYWMPLPEAPKGGE